MNRRLVVMALALFTTYSTFAQKSWTLAECIDHATTHNLSIQKARANAESQAVTVFERRGALLPNVSAAVQQGLNWRPLSEAANSFVNNGIASSSARHATYSGSYGVNASWTAWNGGRTQLNIANAELAHDIALLACDQNSNNIAEQIAQLYVQILYMQEALRVNEQLAEADQTIYDRGRDMVEQGQMSRSDLAQLEAQLESGRYDVVNTATQIAQLKLTLKQLLELGPTDDINLATADVTDAQALRLIPDKMDVFNNALDLRPEIRSGRLAVEQSKIATRIARAQRLPTLSVSAGLSDSHMSGSQSNAGTQMRNNLATSVGAGLQIPLFDQRQARAAIQRARIGELSTAIDLQDAEKNLYQTIEQYWLNATNSQKKYLASKVQVRALTTNYSLLDDQFRLGLKNIADLLQARDNLLRARQTNLQDKYTAVLNSLLLDFYNGQAIAL